MPDFQLEQFQVVVLHVIKEVKMPVVSSIIEDFSLMEQICNSLM